MDRKPGGDPNDGPHEDFSLESLYMPSRPPLSIFGFGPHRDKNQECVSEVCVNLTLVVEDGIATPNTHFLKCVSSGQSRSNVPMT